ncbi:hypothetical protein GCM10010174_79250 [Kutzneria viridogrisea]|uniref:Uncharacterized protein n=1 Tax=Kutzneria viridogrisea TaxID=47990 RepID=A0ABR6BC95_9PSEU|nr:hypothetical protein [Kutzneria viridogrisea]
MTEPPPELLLVGGRRDGDRHPVPYLRAFGHPYEVIVTDDGRFCPLWPATPSLASDKPTDLYVRDESAEGFVYRWREQY